MGTPFTGQYVEEKVAFGGDHTPLSVQPEQFRTFVKEGKVVAVTFLCPCGCGSECYTPVMDATVGETKKQNRWLYSAGPTLYPSIRYVSGCKAHFNITDGKAVFHGDSGK